MRVERLSVQGFRGFLDRRELPMANGKHPTSLCIYGDNGSGKSSIGDAVEFFFSDDGILSRLAKKETENNAGVSATRHALAAKKNIRTEVVFHLSDGKGFARSTGPSGLAGTIPDEVRQLLEDAPVPLLMRSHEMKTFVADEKGAKRYEILSRWVGLERLVDIQDALTKIVGRVKKWNSPASLKAAQVQALERLTDRAVREWMPPAVVRWMNEKLAKAAIALKVTRLDELEQIDKELQALQQNEESRTAVTRYEEGVAVLERSLAGSPCDAVFAASAKALEALRHLDEVRSRMTVAELRPVWSAARAYLESASVSDCPVCTRPFEGTVTQASVLKSLEGSLAAIASLDEAEARVKTSSLELKRAATTLAQQLSRLGDALRACSDEALGPAIGCSDELIALMRGADNAIAIPKAWHDELNVCARSWQASLAGAREHCHAAQQRLRVKLSVPFEDLRLSIQQLIAIREGWNRADHQERAEAEVAVRLEAVAEAIRNEVRSHVKKVLEGLQEEVRQIYASLRGSDDYIPAIDILVSEDKKSMRVAMSLFGVDRVPPSGYLSDSQLNSLGLALYLAAARRFNSGFHFLVLDDIMSSYDASHRLALVDVLAKYLGDFQVIVTTHDRAFYKEIRSVLSDGGHWQFLQLKPWLFETGVRIDDDISVDADIERRLKDGEKEELVAQLIMGTVEDWLLKICCNRGLEVPMKIGKDGSPSEPTMGTLWSSAQKAFKEELKKHAAYPLLHGHPILNWSRHASTAASLGVSRGDLQTFWKSYKNFRDDFAAAGKSAP